MPQRSLANPSAAWRQERQRLLNELIIIQLLKLNDEQLRRTRSAGFVFANLADIVNFQMTENTVRIVFGSWDDMEDVAPRAGREWLMAFNYAVGYLGAPGEMEFDDTTDHPWNTRFDSESPDRIRAMLIQFVIDMDPVSVVADEMAHRVFDLSGTSSRLLARISSRQESIGSESRFNAPGPHRS